MSVIFLAKSLTVLLTILNSIIIYYIFKQFEVDKKFVFLELFFLFFHPLHYLSH